MALKSRDIQDSGASWYAFRYSYSATKRGSLAWLLGLALWSVCQSHCRGCCTHLTRLHSMLKGSKLFNDVLWLGRGVRGWQGKFPEFCLFAQIFFIHLQTNCNYNLVFFTNINHEWRLKFEGIILQNFGFSDLTLASSAQASQCCDLINISQFEQFFITKRSHRLARWTKREMLLHLQT